MYRRLLLLVVLCLFQLSSHYIRCETDAEDLNTVLETAFKCHNNPGVNIALVKNGKVLFTAGYGVTDYERNYTVTNSTLFNVASVTKNVAAALLTKLLSEKSNLTLNSRVKDLLGDEFKLHDHIRKNEMTFADVLAHRTGVPPNNIIRFDQSLTRKNLLQHLAKLKTPDQFRVKYFYNSVMYGLATYIIEVLGNSTFEDLVTEHFLIPLGMSKTTFVTKVNFSREDVAWPYAEENGKLVRVPTEFIKRWGVLAGSVSLVISAEDMAKWMNFHLSKGRDSQGRVVMDENLLNELYTPRMALPTPAEANFRRPNVPHTFSLDTYTLGLKRGYYREYQTISHSGSNNGFRSHMFLLPSEKIGAFIGMSGTDNADLYRTPVLMYLVDIALGHTPWLNASTLCTYPAPWRSASKAVPFRPVAGNTSLQFPSPDYEGVYFNDAYGNLEVAALSSGLILSYGWATWSLIPYRNNGSERFYAVGINLIIGYDVDPIEFIRESSNKFKIRAIGFEPDSPPVFTRSSHDIRVQKPNVAVNERMNSLYVVFTAILLRFGVHLFD